MNLYLNASFCGLFHWIVLSDLSFIADLEFRLDLICICGFVHDMVWCLILISFPEGKKYKGEVLICISFALLCWFVFVWFPGDSLGMICIWFYFWNNLDTDWSKFAADVMKLKLWKDRIKLPLDLDIELPFSMLPSVCKDYSCC